jgi:hypothetical protein
MKKNILSLLSILLIGLFVVGSASAFMGNGIFRNEKIHDAIADEDYTSWKQAVESELTEENFNQMLERRNNREQDRETHDLMRQAIEDNDYEAWLEAAESLENYPKDIETITEEDFNTLVEIHNARESGDFELVHELMEDSDLPFGIGPQSGKGRMGGPMQGEGRGMGFMN